MWVKKVKKNLADLWNNNHVHSVTINISGNFGLKMIETIGRRRKNDRMLFIVIEVCCGCDLIVREFHRLVRLNLSMAYGNMIV